jgi:hypothetical protein
MHPASSPSAHIRPIFRSTQTRRVLHHPTQQFTERDTSRFGDIRHERGRSHPRLGIDFQPDNFAIIRETIVETEV